MSVLWYIFVFLIAVLVLSNFLGEVATLWILGLILLGMVFHNWDSMSSTMKSFTKGLN